MNKYPMYYTKERHFYVLLKKVGWYFFLFSKKKKRKKKTVSMSHSFITILINLVYVGQPAFQGEKTPPLVN